ncbi:MAG: hypothetical protein P8I94_11545, partial [Emcibacteraceae bacterium]|nr:hypothetical protein [Emcibacteraceae bacterium]
GGFITFNSPLSSGDEVVIVSGIPFNRTTDYQNNGDFRPEVVNADFDRVVSLVKQVVDDVSENTELINELDANNLKRSGGQNDMQQPLNMAFNRLINLTAPQSATDAARLQDITKNPSEGDKVLSFPFLDAAVFSTGIQEGDALNLAERTTGNGGGAMWDVVLASSVTPNTFDVVQCVGLPNLALVIRNSEILSLSQLGADPSGAVDITPVLLRVNDIGKPVRLTRGVYLVSTTVALTVPITIETGNFTFNNSSILSFESDFNAVPNVYIFNTSLEKNVKFLVNACAMVSAHWWRDPLDSTGWEKEVNKALESLARDMVVGLMPGEYEADDTIDLTGGRGIRKGLGVFNTTKRARFGESNTSKNLPLRWKSSTSFPATDEYRMIDATGSNQFFMSGWEVVGNNDSDNGTTIGLWIGDNLGGAKKSDNYFDNCSFVNHKIGMRTNLIGFVKFDRCNWSKNLTYGVFAEKIGDATWFDCGWAQNGTSANTDPNVNGAINFYRGANNNEIIGGKIENNQNGLIVEKSTGIVVSGVTIDDNKLGNIYVKDFADLIVDGCLFLGGGYVAGGGLSGQHIGGNLSSDLSDADGPYFKGVRLTLTGNRFHLSRQGAAVPYPPTDAQNGANELMRFRRSAGSEDVLVRVVSSGNNFEQSALDPRIFTSNVRSSQSFYQTDGDSFDYAMEFLFSPSMVCFGKVGGLKMASAFSNITTGGAWNKGDRWFNHTSGQWSERVVTALGQYGSFPSVATVSGSDGVYNITSSATDIQYFQAGDVIKIDTLSPDRAAVKWVDYINGIIYLQNTSNGPVTNQNVSYIAPSYKTLEIIP